MDTVKKWARCEDGSISIEALLWFIMVILVTAVLLDATVLFDSQSSVMRVLQDANRSASLGRLATPVDVENFIEARLALLSPNAVATSAFGTDGVISTSVMIPAGDVKVSGILSSLSGLDMTVSADHLMEDWSTR